MNPSLARAAAGARTRLTRRLNVAVAGLALSAALIAVVALSRPTEARLAEAAIGAALVAAAYATGRFSRGIDGRSTARGVARLANERERARRLTMHADAPWVFNRWYFDFRLNEEVERCRRYGFSLTLLLIRLPQAREAEVRIKTSELVQRLSTGLRPFDIPAQLSDSEYIVCLIQCDRYGAESVARRLGLADAFDAHAALAVLPADGEDARVLMRVAESRLEAGDTIAA